MMKLPSAISAAMVVTFCAIGFIYQFYEISYLHFQYITVPMTLFQEIFVIPAPHLSVCFALVDVLNISKAKKNFDLDFYHRQDNPDFDWPNHFDTLAKLTVNEIFLLTPQAEELIERCIIRFPDKHGRDILDKETCNKVIKVEKFLHRDLVCYKLIPDIKDTYYWTQVLMSGDNFGLLFLFVFDTKLIKDTMSFTTYIHDHNSIELYDSSLAVYNHRRGKGDFMVEVLTTYYNFGREDLEPPHDTMCRNYGDKISVTDFFYNYTRDMLMEKVKKVSLLGFVREGYNLPLLTSNDLQNSTIHQLMGSFGDKFSKWPNTCKYNFFTPALSFKSSSITKFGVYWPRNLGLKVYHRPKENFVDYVIYVCSSIGIWLGLSVYGCLNGLVTKVKNKVTPSCTIDTLTEQVEHLKLKLDFERFSRRRENLNLVKEQKVLLQQFSAIKEKVSRR